MPAKELLISISELTKAEIVCRKDGCGASITVDFTKDAEPLAQCPSCKEPLGGAIWNIAKAWRQLYREAMETTTLQFRVKMP